MKTHLIPFLALVLFCSLGCTDKESTLQTNQDESTQLEAADITDPSKSSGMRMTEEILKHTILESYSVQDTDLAAAVEILNKASKKYASELHYPPLNFVVQDAVRSERVTLTTRNSSMKLISEVLAEQAGIDIEVTEFKILFTRGDWCIIGEDDPSSEQESLPRLPDPGQ